MTSSPSWTTMTAVGHSFSTPKPVTSVSTSARNEFERMRMFAMSMIGWPVPSSGLMSSGK